MKNVNLTYHIEDFNLYSGKLLGFLDRSQFFRLYNDPQKFTRKISSCTVKSLDTISKVKDFKNNRLVFSTKIGSERCLLITAEISEKDVILVKKEIEIHMVDVHGNMLHLIEESTS